MRCYRRYLLFALLLPLFGALFASAGEPAPGVPSFGGFPAMSDPFAGFAKKEPELLRLELAPESDVVAAGKPFTIILTLVHDKSAYSYWANPGGPGVATKVKWNLPEGFRISEPEWPAPERYNNGAMTFYVLKGRASLAYAVTPPASMKPGTRWKLSGEVETQVCTPRTCTPLRLPVSVEVTAAAEAGAVAPGQAAALSALPEAPRSWRFEAVDYADELVIGMYPGPGANADPGEVYFFNAASEPFVDSQKPQIVEREDNVLWLRLPRLPGPSRAGETLAGVIRGENGWLEGATGVSAFRLNLPVIAEGSGRPPGLQRPVEHWGVVLLFAFLGGLLLNVMPCVFPVIGLKIMGFAKQAHKERRAVFLHGLAYMAGVLICFWTLSFLVITMGRGWGAQLQSEWFLFLMCHLFMIMSMNMAGVFEVGATVTGAGQGFGGGEGLKRSFFTGLLATLTSTPCSAPFLGTALAYALSLPAFLSLGVFTLMGLGFAFPYLALSLFPGWLKRLPKPGPWMDTFRQAMCFPLFATTAYLFWTIEAMMDEWRFLMLLFGLVLTAMACWLYGRHQVSRARRPGRAKWLAVLAAVCVAGGIWLGLPKSGDSLEWGQWSPETVRALRSEGRAVYVDFTARWCATCQLNKRVYSDKELRRLVREKGVVLLKADWTLYDERITSTLRDEFNKAAVPVTVLYAPGKKGGEVLPDILTADIVSAALRKLK